jgi:DNA-binding NarL/FixJ family response regulator
MRTIDKEDGAPVSEGPLRILIADDHPFFREGLRAVVGVTPGMELAGEAANGDQAVEMARTLQPDVILMDLKMPGSGGLAATRRILQDNPQVGILVITMIEDDESVFAALRAGARGYLLKGADKEEVLLAVQAVARGEAIFGPAIARRLVNYFARSGTLTRSSRSAFPELTDREREILDLIAAGKNNNEISESLYLSLKTVRNYVSSIFTKLQVADRAQAIVRGREAGMGAGKG